MTKYDVVFIVSELVSGENVVRKRQNCGAEMAFGICDFGWNSLCYCGFVVQCGGLHVEIGKIILYFQWMLCRFPAFWLPIWWFDGAEIAVGDINPSFSWCDYLRFRIQIACFITRIQGFPHSFHHFPNTITPIPDTIPSFSNQNFTTSTHHFGKSTHKSTVLSTRICRFPTRIARFLLFFRRLRGLFAAVFCNVAAKNVMRHGVFVVKFGVIRRKNIEIRCRNGEIRCRNAEIIAGYAEIWCSFHCFRVGFRRKYGAKTAKWWGVSGVSNPDFTNFTKHSTVLTSILQ